MINQNLNPKYQKETTISRQTRDAFLTAVVLAIASLLNLIVSFRISLETHAIASIIDTVSVAIFFIDAIYVAVLIRNNEKDRGIWQLIFVLVVVLGIRNFVDAGMGYIFGALVAVLIPFIALLTLNQGSFNRALALGLAAASAYLVFDIFIERYFPAMRQSGEIIKPMIRMVGIITILLTVSYFYVLLRQSRFIPLSSKLPLGMTIVVMLPLILLGVISTVSLNNSLLPRQQQAMTSRTAYLAENVNTFLRTTRSSVSAEAQSPIVREYLRLNDPSLREIALQTLLSYKRKDILHIDSYALLDATGKNILDTEYEHIGLNEGDEAYFQKPFESGLGYISEINRGSIPGQFYVIFSAPVKGFDGTSIGVLRARYKTEVFGQFFNTYTALTQGDPEAETYGALLYEIPANKLDENDPEDVYLILANTTDSDWDFKVANHLTTNVITPLQTSGMLPPGSTAQLSLNLPGIEEGMRNRENSPTFDAQAFPRETEVNTPPDYISTAPLSEKSDWVVMTSQTIMSVNSPIQKQRETITFITILIAIGASILAYFSSRFLIAPIVGLTKISEKVAQGDFSHRVHVETEDEIGTLGLAFNAMTSQLENLITTLEDRVENRTSDLKRQSQQLQAAVEVGKVAVSLRNLDNLLTQATELISLRFGFYHIGIFLLDQKGEYAVLRAANSEGGKRMLNRNHQLKVGETGIVGYVTQTGQARIALDVGQDAVYFDNPNLPQTRSEMALALIAGGRILGALDIQSTQGEAFSEADITTLQVLADQIAISIENARLFEENRNSLQALRRAYGEQSRASWQEIMHTRGQYGYQGKRDGSIVPIDEPATPTSLQAIAEKKVILDEARSTANIPIVVRGNPIGILRLAKPETAHSWTESELELASTLSNELSGALDSARLFDETRKQAEQEYVVGEITDKMRESMNVESIIKTAADEIYKLLKLEHIAIHFTPVDDEKEQNEGVA